MVVLSAPACGRLRFDAVGTPRDGRRDGPGDGLVGDAPVGIVAHVQSADGKSGGSNAVAATFPSPSEQGDVIAVAFQWDDAGAVTGITDDAGDTYTPVGATLTSGTHFAQIAYASVVTVGSSPITVTANIDAQSSKLSIIVEDVRGADPTVPLASSNARAQMAPGVVPDGITTGPLSFSGANNYLFAASFDASGNTSTFTPGTGFTVALKGSNGSTTYMAEYAIDVEPGAFSATPGFATYMTLGMAFRP